MYPSAIDLSTSTLTFLTQRLTAHRAAIGSRWRTLPTGRQALLVLAHLRCGGTYARLAAGFGIGTATVYRYIHEAVDLLTALGPDLAEAMRTARHKAYLILDGTLIRIDRVALDRPYYSGKYKRHGVNLQVLADPAGRLVWVSPGLPGATHDLTAARTDGLIGALTEAERKTYADKASQGAGQWIRVPYRGHGLAAGPKAVNRSHAKVRALGEPAVATIKTWRILRRHRGCPTRITGLATTILVLHLQPAR